MSAVNVEKRSPLDVLARLVSGLLGGAWFWMLALGILHHHDKSIPALGYSVVLLLWFLIGSNEIARTPVINKMTHKESKE